MKDVWKRWFPAGSLGCFFCGVDTKPLLIFFVGMIGSLALGTLLTGFGLWLRGSFRNPEAMKEEIFRAEERV